MTGVAKLLQDIWELPIETQLMAIYAGTIIWFVIAIRFRLIFK